MRRNLILLLILSGAVSCKMFRDTEGWDIKSKHNSDNEIFRTNSKFTYSVYRTKGSDTLGSYIVNHLKDTLEVSKVILTVLPGQFMGQTKMKWEYTGLNDSVVHKAITGIVEDSNRVWIHPPRTGIPFVYTEAAPFPEIRFPIENGKQWTGGLTGLKGYQEIGLEGKVTFEYAISGREDINTDYKPFTNCWKIQSKGESSIGTSTHTYFYDKKYGFIHSEYNFPTGEKLVITLKDYKAQ